MAVPWQLEQEEEVRRMSNCNEHLLLGALFGFGTYVAAKRAQGETVDLGNAVGWGVMGAGVAVLPDIIEPAYGPNHRSFAHSLTAAGIVTHMAKETWGQSTTSAEQKAAAASLAAAYLSHLLADALTPKGLPIA